MGLWVNAAGCTNACRHCYVYGRPPYGAIYSLEELHRIVDEWGPVCILYEPTVHPQFPEIMHPRLTGHEKFGFLPTNGFGLATRNDCPKVFNRLRELGFHSLSVTLHGLETNHERFVGGRRGAFQAMLSACREAKKAGFGLHWNVFLDRHNVGDVPALLELANGEFDIAPHVGVPSHRVGKRAHVCERLRPSRTDVARFLERCSSFKFRGAVKTEPLDRLTESAWLERWKRESESEEFVGTTKWPLAASIKGTDLQLDAQRRIFLDLPDGEWIPLGTLADGKQAILDRLPQVPRPPHSQMRPEQARLREADADLVHEHGSSIRAKAISLALFGPAGQQCDR